MMKCFLCERIDHPTWCPYKDNAPNLQETVKILKETTIFVENFLKEFYRDRVNKHSTRDPEEF